MQPGSRTLPVLEDVSADLNHPYDGPAPKISSLLIKPASALCNLDCSYCFYLDRETDPYKALASRRMSLDTLERLVDSYLAYSHPQATFAFQGGEPTLAGLSFFQHLVRFQEQYGEPGLSVGNSMQTNGVLIDKGWCELFREYNWLLGVSLDGPEKQHDLYRVNKGGAPTWRKVMSSLELLRKQRVEFNILCVLSSANVDRPGQLYRWFRRHGFNYLQFIPLSDFQPDGTPQPFTITPAQYGRFLTEVFEEWWPERRTVRIRFFDNLAESVAGMCPGSCTMQSSCDSYAVVEYNGDVYPCDFFVEQKWKLGNILSDSWDDIAGRQRRHEFAAKKSLPNEACRQCEFLNLCQRGCPKDRHGPAKRFEDLDYFCESYKAVFRRAAGPLAEDVRKLLGR